ncbi:MAG: hypothetical protein JSW04_03065 [Desulfobacterales bacterium]|nr:MAG: hypothetical protein JSW04_03065 [Desulfobacterales bacterium]
MPSRKHVASLFKEHKTIFIIIAVVIFLIELEIFAFAAMKSGRKSWLQVLDTNGSVIHETDGKNLSDFNKYYFEKTFGPFEQYNVKLVTKEIPFPFRAWFVAAIGIPVGIVLLFGFVVRAYMALVYGGGAKADDVDPNKDIYEYRFEKIIAAIGRFNIFTIGFLVLLAVFSYWVIPNIITYIGRVGVDTLIRYKWVFLSIGFIFLGVILWIIYLRYLLAKKAIDSQTEVDKYRLQLEYHPNGTPPPQLEHDRTETRSSMS